MLRKYKNSIRVSMTILFSILANDWVMEMTLAERNTRLILTLWITFKDTNNTDEYALLSHIEDHMQEKTKKLEENVKMT